jgi:hypothetical protein
MNTHIAELLLGAALIGLTAGAQAETISWNANAAQGAGDLTAFTAGSFTVAQINNSGNTTMINNSSSSSGYTGYSGGNNFSATSKNTGATINPASNTGFVFSFGLTEANAYLTLNSFSFGSRSTATGPSAYTILISNSADFSEPLYSFNGTFRTDANTNWHLFNVLPDISTSPGGGDYYLGIFSRSASGSTNTANWRTDDLVFDYTVSAMAVPEPSIWAMLGIGAGLLLLRLNGKIHAHHPQHHRVRIR